MTTGARSKPPGKSQVLVSSSGAESKFRVVTVSSRRAKVSSKLKFLILFNGAAREFQVYAGYLPAGRDELIRHEGPTDGSCAAHRDDAHRLLALLRVYQQPTPSLGA